MYSTSLPGQLLISRLTRGGVHDISSQPHCAAWRDRSARSKQMPDAGKLAAASSWSAISKIQAQRRQKSHRYQPGSQREFCAAWAASAKASPPRRRMAVLRRHSAFAGLLVAGGGDIVVGDAPRTPPVGGIGIVTDSRVAMPILHAMSLAWSMALVSPPATPNNSWLLAVNAIPTMSTPKRAWV